MVNMLSAIDRLRLFLRPPGRGLYTISTGGGYAARLLKTLYGSIEAGVVQRAWEDDLQRVRRAKVLILGIPSDTGAGVMKGANFGPIGIREAYLQREGTYPKDILDLGDVVCVPHLLHDEMLSDAQIARTRESLYPGCSQPLPVSPLSIAEEVLYAVAELNPEARVCVLGGDHSVSWPAILGASKLHANEFGVLHFDAHTDLMESRLGVRYCFATWAFHASHLLKPRCLLQVGVRTSLHDRAYWETHLPVTQIWSKEVLTDPTGSAQRILDHFSTLGIKKIYISNDIDGTDSPEAPATGTPEKSGLHADWIESLILQMRDAYDVIGGDVVEVAPPLSGIRDYANEPTCRLGARYLKVLF